MSSNISSSVKVGVRKKNINIPEIELNFAKYPKRRYSISPKAGKISSDNNESPNNRNNSFYFNNMHKNKMNEIPFTTKRTSASQCKKRKSIVNCNISPKRRSQEISYRKAQKFIQMYNMKIEKDKIERRKTIANMLANTKDNIQLNKIENNIKQAINNMRKEIEKKKIRRMPYSVKPENIKKKLDSSPSLRLLKLKGNKKNKRKRNFKNSVLMKKINIYDQSFTSNKKIKKKRNKSFEYTLQQKKNIIKRLKHKIYKNKNKLSIINLNSSINDEIENKDNSKGIAFHPNSYFILIFDMLLMISVIYTFVEIPLNVAKNKDIREVGPIFRETIHYIIDLIFFLDFIICFFRGYYNNEMDLIINNKKIFYNYIENNFLFDLLEGFPLYSLIRILMKQNKSIYVGYSQIESISITFLLLIKPLKIFKIIKRKNNKVIEELFMLVNENYNLERLFKFLIYFLIFFLFVHLFICLHIYFALQSYPNWLVHIDIINENFLAKYLASFYFLMTTMTTVGYGDIVCISFFERIYHIILLVIGTLLYTFLVSKIGNYLRDQSHEQTKLDKDLNILESIRITHPNMPFKLYSKIKNHLLTIFKKRKKIGISLLINGVPDAIKNDLLFKIYSKVINGFNIFKDVKNSNFIIQMLTSFIPIIFKKEEIIFLEGEIIQNIVFVKDGRLSLELVIDLNEPFKSIERYVENNFIGISREEELKNYNSNNGQKTTMNLPEINYNDLKARINDIINSKKSTLIGNSRIDNNGISIDLGRMDFTQKEAEQSQLKDLQIIKIIDIRKNEHFGDIHLFLEKPSPFTLKAKSRIAELLFLRKNSAMFMSKNFQNIWRKIETKSFHNLVSIKKLTFKILKQYLNTHYYPRTEMETNTLLNLDKNFISNISFSENYASHKVSLTRSNFNTSNIKSPIMNMNKSFNSLSKNSGNNNNNTLEKIKLQSSINKKKLFVGYNSHRKKNNSIEILNDNLDLSSDSLNSNSYPSSHFKLAKIFPQKNNLENQPITIININQENEEEENDKVENLVNNRLFSKSYKKNIIKKNNTNSAFSFKNDNQSSKFLKMTNRKSSADLLYTGFDSKKQSDKTINCESFENQNTIKCSNKGIENTNNNNNDLDFLIFTLEDVNKNFSKRIKKRLKKRKKIQKLKELLKLQKLKINKNLIELYLNQIMLKQNSKTNIDSNISNRFIYDNSTYSSDMKQMSQILDSNSSEETSIQIQNSAKFKNNSLKIMVSESFQIKSSYTNINILTKGEIIRNINCKLYLENLIKQSFNKNIVKDDLCKSSYSIKTQNSKKSKIKIVKFRSGFEKDSFNNNNNNRFLFDRLSSKFNKYKLSEKTLKNYCLNILEQNDKNNKNKNFQRKFEKDLEDIGSIKLFQNKKAQKSKILNDNKMEGKELLFGKKVDKKNNGQVINDSCNNATDKVITSTLNALNEYEKDKDNDKDNKLALLNQQNLNSYENVIQKNNIEKEKTNNNCIVF